MNELDDLSLSQRMHAAPSEAGAANGSGLYNGGHGKVINDPIHKHFRLGPTAVQIMDSPQFQRLRELKQLGLSYYVFPGASHNRFEHCLGVAHLGYEFAMHFKLGQPELEITSEDLKVVEIAGLCHDLGHGPFSHVFHYGFLEKAGVHDWSHEDMSVKILDTIVEDKGLIDNGLTEDQLSRIKAMILAAGTGVAPERSGRQYLHEIVANGRNGLDVDKFDYLVRDAHCCGVPIAAEIDRLKTFSKVLDNEICYKWSEYDNVLQIFQTRAAMHKRVYGHRKAKAIDHMVCDALLAADPALGLTRMIDDPREFVRLDDTVLKRIEHHGAFGPRAWCAGDADDAGIRTAQGILRRLRERDLYRWCGEWVIPAEEVGRGWRQPTPAEIIECGPSGSGVGADDVIVMVVAIDLTAGNSNPLDNVSFFESFKSKTKHTLRGSNMTRLIPADYEERIMRVYSRKSEPAATAAVAAAATRYVKLRFGDRVVCRTPQRSGAQMGVWEPNGALVEPSRKRRLPF